MLITCSITACSTEFKMCTDTPCKVSTKCKLILHTESLTLLIFWWQIWGGKF
jgi:hypothetical protein